MNASCFSPVAPVPYSFRTTSKPLPSHESLCSREHSSRNEKPFCAPTVDESPTATVLWSRVKWNPRDGFVTYGSEPAGASQTDSNSMTSASAS
jgi:hypothetical protein